MCVGKIWKVTSNDSRERDMINYGKQLNDRHINPALAIIWSQFSIKGMQLTLYQHTKGDLKMSFKLSTAEATTGLQLVPFSLR